MDQERIVPLQKAGMHSSSGLHRSEGSDSQKCHCPSGAPKGNTSSFAFDELANLNSNDHPTPPTAPTYTPTINVYSSGDFIAENLPTKARYSVERRGKMQADAAADKLAHEIGHVLALTHVAFIRYPPHPPPQPPPLHPPPPQTRYLALGFAALGATAYVGNLPVRL